MTEHTYTTKYRPPGFATVPAGFRFVASGKDNPLPLRTDLPRSPHRFGVVAYDRPLTARELEAYEMVPVDPPAPRRPQQPHVEGVDWIATGNFDGFSCGSDADPGL